MLVDAKSRNMYEAIWEGLDDSLDRIKGWDGITKMSRLVLVTMSTVLSPGKIRNKESGTGLRGKGFTTFSVTSLWDVQVKMALGKKVKVSKDTKFESFHISMVIKTIVIDE